MDFDPRIAQRGLLSAERLGGVGERLSSSLWRLVADDVWIWLVRWN